jgi:undecaprenol kinase
MITPETEIRTRRMDVTADAEIDESLVLLNQKQAYADEVLLGSWRRKTGSSAHMIESFFHAFHGIWVGLKEERNLRIHFFAAAVVIGLGIWLRVDASAWIRLALAMGLVLVTEFLNTAIEHLVDLTSEGRYHKSARYAKDTAAAAVLCASITAVAVGVMVFTPYLEPILKRF